MSTSRPIGVASTPLIGLVFDLKSEKPSWCLDVMTMYFIPASFARRTHSSALYLMGLNCFARLAYSGAGIRARFMIHSTMLGMVFHFHCPAGIVYSPKWLINPYFASRHHASR